MWRVEAKIDPVEDIFGKSRFESRIIFGIKAPKLDLGIEQVVSSWSDDFISNVIRFD
jgi:hypothetical protein